MSCRERSSINEVCAMKLEEFTERYETLSKQQRLLFLSTIVSELTLAGRGTYMAGTDAVADPPRLRAINEFEHRVVSHLRDVIAGSRERHPDDVICQVIFESARELQLSGVVDRAFASMPAAG